MEKIKKVRRRVTNFEWIGSRIVLSQNTIILNLSIQFGCYIADARLWGHNEWHQPAKHDTQKKRKEERNEKDTEFSNYGNTNSIFNKTKCNIYKRSNLFTEVTTRQYVKWKSWKAFFYFAYWLVDLMSFHLLIYTSHHVYYSAEIVQLSYSSDGFLSFFFSLLLFFVVWNGTIKIIDELFMLFFFLCTENK